MKNALIIAGPDVHAVCMAAATNVYLEKQGYQVDILSEFPATHPDNFWLGRKGEGGTIDTLDVAGYQRVVILDLPLDAKRGEESLSGSLKKLAALAGQVPVTYVDHHQSSEFLTTQKENGVRIQGLKVVLASSAETTCLGRELPRVRWLGAVCDRDTAVLESKKQLTEHWRTLALGADIAVRPDWRLPAFTPEWFATGRVRLAEAIVRMKAQDWAYFEQMAEEGLPPTPVAARVGNVAIIETTFLPGSWALKVSEAAMQSLGCTYAVLVGRDVNSAKKGQPEQRFDLITVFRDWAAVDALPVQKALNGSLGEMASHGYFANELLWFAKWEPDATRTARATAQILRVLAGDQLPDFSQVKAIGIGGLPHSGKSTFMSNLELALKLFGVKAFRARTDLAAPYPGWFIRAEERFARGEISEAELNLKREKRQRLKQPWTMPLAQDAKRMVEAATDHFEVVLADMPGKITDITSTIAEACDTAFMVGRADKPEAMAEWVTFFEERGIRVLAEFVSILEGDQQSLAEGSGDKGIVTELDQSKVRATNPVVMTVAILIAEALLK